MVKKKFNAKVTKEMKICYERITFPPYPIFKRREIPILLLKRLATVLDEYTPTKTNMIGGIFYGAAGVGYTLLRLASYPLFETVKELLLLTAKDYADASMLYCNSQELPHVSLLLGKAGIYAVCAVIYKKLSLYDQARECVHLFQAQGADCLLKNYVLDGGEDLCDGRAGYLAGALWLRKHFKGYFTTNFFYKYLDLIVQSCREHSKEFYTISSLGYSRYNMEYTGMLYGFGGVLFVILCFPSYLDKHRDVDEEVKLSVDTILLRQMADGQFFPLMNSDLTIPGDILKWNNGGTGLLYLMAKAYLRWNHSRYYYSCLLAGDLIWNYGLEFILTDGRNGSGIGLDHGLAGNIYGLLTLYRLTKHPIYLQKAHICSIPFREEKHHQKFNKKQYKYSLFNGLSGALVFLLDLIDIEHAEFPFLPVFYYYDEYDDEYNDYLL